MFRDENKDILLERRIALAFFFFICLTMFSVLRLSVISLGDEYLQMQNEQGQYRKTIAILRGTIFDTNMLPLTNNKSEKYVAIPPLPEAIMDVPSFLYGKEKEKVLKKLKNNEIAVVVPKGKVNSKSIIETDIYKTDYENFDAEHLIGYTDESGHGVCGIQKAYDDVLYSEKNVDLVYSINGKGKVVFSTEPEFENDLSVVANGVRLTIDINIQNIVSEAAQNIKKGAALVCDAKSAKIRAMVSKPSFSPENISEALSGEDSPLINRAITPFAVGSVFKPCIATAAINSGNEAFLYNCEGKTHIIDRDFSCHNKDGHGLVNLKEAIGFSCNTFFYNLGITVGAQKLYETASVFSFGTKIKLGENYYTESGNLTSIKNLNNDAQIANFSIGQGDICLSPVSILPLYLAIANNGEYTLPSVVESVVCSGKETKYNSKPKTRAMTNECAEFLKEALIGVTENGTGEEARVENLTVAGKTATAQTGRYDQTGKEITNSWFCGFFPAQDPKYVVIVMLDGENSISAASVFSQIAEKIYNNT